MLPRPSHEATIEGERRTARPLRAAKRGTTLLFLWLLMLALPSAAAPPPPKAVCGCAPDLVLPGGSLATLQNVATSGKASTVTTSVAVRLKAVDLTPGSCTAGSSSDPATVSIHLEDDDGDVILDRSKTGAVCTNGKKTYAKFPVTFEGPKNCKDSLAPASQSKGTISIQATTGNGAVLTTRKLTCAAAVPVDFSFSPRPNYHVTAGATLHFSVTAMRRGDPLAISVSGLPPSASFDGTNFSWIGAFVDSADDGNYDVTFTAGGESTVINIATTQYPVIGVGLVALNGQPISSLPIAIGGQGLISIQPQFANPYGVPSIGGQGSNGWNKFDWSIDTTYLADFFSATNVAVIDGMGKGTTPVRARFTDAALGDVATAAELDILEVTSIALNPGNLLLPESSTEPLVATATLEGGAQTSRVKFRWSSSDDAVASVAATSVLGTSNVTAHTLGTASIAASTETGPVVTGVIDATGVAPLRDQDLFGLDRAPDASRIVTVDTTGSAQFLASMPPPYNDQFSPSSSYDTNETMVGSFDSSTGFSQIQRISSAGNVLAVFTSTTVTQLGDTIDVQAIRYRPDGQAYFSMSEGQNAFTRVSQTGGLSSIGGPSGNDGYGPLAIAPYGNNLVYSGPWGEELLGKGNKLEGYAQLVARYTTGSNQFFARTGVTRPRLVAPGGNLWVLDASTGELFRFADLNGDGNHFEIQTTTVGGETIQTAVDDPGERILAGQLPMGFDQLQLDLVTGDVIATRIVGSAPQRITVMRVADRNGDGDVNDAGEQTVVFDAGAPAGTDTVGALLKY